MKKITMLFLLFAFSLQTFANTNDNNSNKEQQVSSNASFVEILVEANRAVDDLCNYFEGSWADKGLSLYCSFGGDAYTCTIYKVAKATCSLNGAVRLYLEGDINGSLKKALSGASDIYKISKIGRSEFKLTKSNMTPRSEWY